MFKGCSWREDRAGRVERAERVERAGRVEHVCIFFPAHQFFSLFGLSHRTRLRKSRYTKII